MKETYKISVIVPIHNSEKYLERCIQSILNQDYQNIEVILINDGSTDSSLEIMKNYENIDSRVKVISKENSGVSDTRNIGIKASIGDYVTFIDSDDYLEKESYSVMIKALEKNDADICFASYYIINDMKKEIIKFSWEDNKVFTKKEIVNNFIPRIIGSLKPEKRAIFGSVWRSLFKKTIIDNAIFVKDITVAEDVLFLMDTLYLSNKIVTLNFPIYNYYQHASSTLKRYKENSLERSMRYHEELIKRLSKMNYFENQDNLKRYKCNRFHMYIYALTNLPRNKKNTNKNILQNIKKIVLEFNNDEFKYNNILDEINFSKKIFYFCMKNNFYLIILILLRINHLVRW